MATNIVSPFVADEIYATSARAKCVSIADFWLGAGSTAAVVTWANYHALVNAALTSLGLTTIPDGITGQQWLDRMNAFNNVESNADVAALLARFTVPADAARTKLIAKYVYDLKAAALWSKLDALYLTAGADSQAARRNMIADAYNLATISSPGFVADRGFTGNGSSSYLSSGFNPTTAPGAKFVLNSAVIGHWSLTDLANGAGNSGDIGSNNSRIGRSSLGAGQTVGRPNNATTINPMSATGYPGLIAWSRTAAGVWDIYRNGVDVGGGVDASTALSNDIFMLNAFSNGAGSISTFGVNQEAVSFWGSAFTAADHLAFYNATRTYLLAIGAV